MRVIQERTSANTPYVSYTRGLDLSGSLEGAGGIGGLLGRSHGYSSGNWSTHSVYHADAGGNVTYMLNSSQSMVASYRYDPFGRTISSSGTLAAANVYRFSSKEIHVNSGLYYYGHRFYDPETQRWLNRDPIRELGFELVRSRGIRRQSSSLSMVTPFSQALYTFVENCPTVRYDPFGLAPATGPNTPACALAIERLEAAIALLVSEPSAENAALVAAMDAAAAVACTPPPRKFRWRWVGRGGAIACAGAIGAFTGYWIREEVNKGFETIGDIWYGNVVW